MALDNWTAQAVKNLPEDATVVRKVVHALKAAGNPVTRVWDGEEFINVDGEHQVLNAVFAVDQARLHTATDQWVLIVLGNGYDALADYTVSLEDALKPVNDWWETVA